MNEQIMQQLLMLLGQVKPTETVENTPVKSKRPPVKLVKHKETGKIVNAYENSPDWGYIQVEESAVIQRSRTWIGNQRRTALLKGDVASLEVFVKEKAKNGILPGQIVVKEFREDEVPEDIFRDFVGDPDTREGGYEEAVRPFIKRAGSYEDAVELTSQGQRIMRFSFYDETCEEVDEKIVHENGADVAEYNRNRRAELAEKMLAEKQALAEKAKADAEAEKTNVEKATADIKLPVNDGNKK